MSPSSLPPAPDLEVPGTEESPPRVVILGAGFAGLNAARGLDGAPVEVTLVDRQNHHLFQPLLYQVASAALSPANIAWPIRRLLRHQRNARVLLGEVESIDRERRRLRLAGGESLAYDWLVVATGASHSYFGNDHWARHAPGLKSIDDATAIRRRLLLAFERAEMEPDPEKRRCLLTFVVVGGGPTGVELAGAVVELARKALADDFRTIDPRQARVVLVEAGPRVLAGFPDSLSRRAERDLVRLGVEVRLEQPVTGCHAEGVELGDDFLRAGVVLWAAGVQASPVGDWLAVETDKSGRIPVGPRLTLAEDERVFVLGDAARVLDAAGRELPGIAPAAKQQGSYAARSLRALLRGETPPPFRYRDRGQLATIGRRAAVISYGRLRLRGRLAWWIWGLAHVYFLIGLRSRLLVGLQWLWSYVAFERGARLVTGLTSAGRTDAHGCPPSSPPPSASTGDTNMRDLSGTKIAILATDGFEQSELLEPRRRLSDAGGSVEVVSPGDGSIRGWNKDRWDQSVAVDRRLDEVSVEDYDALVLPGGQINPDVLRADRDAVAFVRRFAESGKPVAAICHGPWLLVEAGLLRGRRATSYHSIRTDLRNAGAEWDDRAVVTDGNLITSRTPDDLPAFVERVAEAVAEAAEKGAAEAPGRQPRGPSS